MASERRLWQKPSLTVLVRMEPTEAVLVTCKWTSWPFITGPGTRQTRCRGTATNCSGNCQNRVAS